MMQTASEPSLDVGAWNVVATFLHALANPGNREAKKNEVILNGADGLNWKTAVRCDVIYLLSKAEFKEQRGKVTSARRVAIARKIAETLRLQMS